MNVLFDAHMVGQRETGNETYSRELIGQCDALRVEGVRLIAAVRMPVQTSARIVVEPRLGDDLRRLTYILPRLASETQAELVHVTYHGPLRMKTPMVVTIHDVSYRVRPGLQSPRNFVIQNSLGYLTARRARLIITVSEFCRSEIARVYPFAANRIEVTYSATQPLDLPADAEARLRTMGLGGTRFVLGVGRFHPRKNFVRLARAFLSATADAPATQLVLAGDGDNAFGRTFRREFGPEIAQGRIRLLGYVGDENLSVLYSRCACFAFPSLYEGFGSPPVEAMGSGAPVIASQTTGLAEIVGPAGLLVRPENEASIAEALRRVLGDVALATDLAARGRARAQVFSRARFARATAAAYRRALEEKAP